MIKAQELRINNIVTDEFYETFRTTIVVESINEKGINLSVQNSDDFPEMQDHWIEPYYEFDKLRGIPLTSEWLERFWFKQFVHDSELQGKIVEYNYDNNLLTIVDWSAEGKKFTLSNSFSFKLRVDVNYVHQLQNLIFAITGSELQLKD